MNKKLKVTLMIAAISVTSLYAADSKIGTQTDPLVTKSYVDAQIAKLKGSSSNSNSSNATNTSDLEKQLTLQQELITVLSEEIASLKANSSSSFEVVKVAEGRTIYGKQSSEIIMRSGEGVVVASTVGGIQDITDGVDLEGGAIVPRNNLLIIPREDGRGIIARKDMVLMVRGGYTIL